MDEDEGVMGEQGEQDAEMDGPHPDPLPEGEGETVERLRGELAAERARGLEAHRRALLAENAGRVVPELVAGETVEGLEASLEVARRAFEAVRAAALTEVASSAPVGAGNSQRGSAVNVETMSPMQKIAYGLRRE
jgi:hypothetical protein